MDPDTSQAYKKVWMTALQSGTFQGITRLWVFLLDYHITIDAITNTADHRYLCHLIIGFDTKISYQFMIWIQIFTLMISSRISYAPDHRHKKWARTSRTVAISESPTSHGK